MRLRVSSAGALRGEIDLPGDKSLSHRAALFAALGEGESRLSNFLVAGVTQVMLNALTALGVVWELDGSTLSVQGAGLTGLCSPETTIDCGNSATTMRLLAGLLAYAGLPAILDGSPGLRRRPMERVVEPLSKMGVPIHADGGRAPLVFGRRVKQLEALQYTLPIASAQVKSCLLIAGLAADGPTRLTEPGPSRDHTERMLRSLGVTVVNEARNGGPIPIHEARGGLYLGVEGYTQVSGNLRYTTHLVPPKKLSLPFMRFSLPGDISSAAFILVAALITPGSQVRLRDVLLNPTRTGLLEALMTMGADIRIYPTGERQGEPIGDVLVRSSSLRAIQVSGPLVVRMIDEFPAFAVAAACARGRTFVRDAQELRHKESNRISALCSELQHLGIDADETHDGFSITGGEQPQGGVVDSHGDHRLAMALTVAGLVCKQPVVVNGAEVISESFPDFLAVLQSLGAQVAYD